MIGYREDGRGHERQRVCTTPLLAVPPTTRLTTVSEAQEGEALCKYMALRHPAAYEHMLHVPNGLISTGRHVNALKRQGLKPGVPDYFIAIPVGRYHGLWLELKTHNGKVRREQTEWLERLTKQDYACVIAYGWDAARQCIEQYLCGDVDRLKLKEMVEQ